MRKKEMIIVALTILFILFSAFIAQSKFAAADITIDTYVSSALEVKSPTVDRAYSGSMPLNFTIHWTTYDGVAWLYLKIGYSIDNQTPIFIPGNTEDEWMKSYTSINLNGTNLGNLYVSSSTDEAVNVNVSALANGEHTLAIILSDGTYQVETMYIESYNCSFVPVSFTVDNSLPRTEILTPNPTPTPIPSITPTITPSPAPPDLGSPFYLGILHMIGIVAVIVAVAAVLLIYFNRHRKN